MLKHESHPPQVKSLASKVVSDIHSRNLTQGDRYLTTEEVAQMLGIRKAAANKTLRYLAEHKILVRKQRSGTLIGPGLPPKTQSRIRTVLVFLREDSLVARSWAFDPFVKGIRNEMKDVNVQFNFIPKADSVANVQELIDAAQATGHFAGIVAISCPPEVYRYLADRHLPTVVLGSLFDRELGLVSADVDNRHSGRLLAQYLIERGHRRIALLLPTLGQPGANDFFEGIDEVLAEAQMPHGTLTLRLVNHDLETVKAMVRGLLAMPNRPSALITRTPLFINTAISILSEMGMRVPQDIEIVCDNVGQTSMKVDLSQYTHVSSTMSFSEIAATLGHLLQRMLDGIFSEERQIVFPMELHVAGLNVTGPSNARKHKTENG